MSVRLGSIEFINSLPVDLGLITRQVEAHAQITTGCPAVLNEKILKKELEISPISTFFYAKHQDDFLILPDLSISSLSGVQSVLLFSRLKLGNLEGGTIALSGQGETTPALLEILCQLRYGFSPNLKKIKGPVHDIPHDTDAVLLIGDEALAAKDRLKDSSLEIIDLAEEWRRWTKLPIVFAVWAARRDFFMNFPEEVFETHQAILNSKEWGLSHLEEVLGAAIAKTKLPRRDLESYFSNLSYGFGEDLKKGMRRFLDCASQCGLVKPVKKFEEISEGCGIA